MSTPSPLLVRPSHRHDTPRTSPVALDQPVQLPGAGPLPVTTLDPIATGIASSAALWSPLIERAGHEPVLLFATASYEVWLEAHAAPTNPGRDPGASVRTAAVAPLADGDGEAGLAALAGLAIHVYSPRRGAADDADAPVAGSGHPADPIGPEPEFPDAVASYLLHPARRGATR